MYLILFFFFEEENLSDYKKKKKKREELLIKKQIRSACTVIDKTILSYDIMFKIFSRVAYKGLVMLSFGIPGSK